MLKSVACGFGLQPAPPEPGLVKATKNVGEKNFGCVLIGASAHSGIDTTWGGCKDGVRVQKQKRIWDGVASMVGFRTII
jgi:hypothetical protein